VKYHIQDLINIEEFQDLQNRLDAICSFPSAIIDNDGTILTATAWQDVCTKFHRLHPECEKECIKSDRYIQDHLAEADPAVSYRCPHGLIDNAVPIIIEGKHLATFFTGQFFLEKPDLEYFRRQAKKYGFPEEAYLEAIKRVPVWTQEQLDNYLHFIRGLIAVVANIGLKSCREIEARKTIRESEEKFRQIANTVKEVFWVGTPDWKGVHYVNPAYANVWGRSCQSLYDDPLSWLEGVHPEDLEYVQAAIQEKRQEALDEPQFPDYRIVRPDGAVRWISARVYPIHDEQGHLVRVAGIAEDVTERKEAEKKIRQQQYYLEKAQELGRIGTWELDLRSNTLLWTDENCRIFGVPPGSVVTYEIFISKVHPDDRQFVDREWQAAVKGKPYDIEHRVLIDGVTTWVREKAEVTFDDHGVAISAIGFTQDITTRKTTEEQLRKTTAVLEEVRKAQSVYIDEEDPKKTLAALLHALVTLTESEHGFLDEVLTDQAGEVYKKSLAITDISWDEGSRHLYAELEAGNLEFRNLANLAGAPVVSRSLVISNNPVHDPRSGGLPPGHPALSSFMGIPLYYGGELVGVAGVANRKEGYSSDLATSLEPFTSTCASIISALRDRRRKDKAEEERLQLERQVQHAQKLESLGILAGGIAHDFNNLLMTILGNADLALLDSSPVSPVRGNIKAIETAAQRAADLARQMLAYSGRGAFEMNPLDLSEVVDEMTYLLQSSISGKVHLNLDLDRQLPAIKADAAQLQQVIMNLIINASEAIGPDQPGSVSISTGLEDCSQEYLEESELAEKQAAGKFVFLEVSDTGCGMDEKTKTMLFDPFFTTKFTGRGLGMAAVLGIVKGHGGAIMLDTEPGRGTTFRVLFPAMPATAQKSERHDSSAKQGGWQEEGTILIADDDKAILQLAGRMIERFGFKTLLAADGREAIRIFQENVGRITCVLLDLTMPHMDGAETCIAIQSIRNDVPIILSSGYQESELAARFDGYGMAAFIQKPYKLAKLEEVLRTVLENRND